mmetsp:Transcript_5476/g.12283  ORF Transcript_5476/g.12283 Transcript_5476/m.12283 type:complete len:271 (-) Transcript_5476:440-1252(-)
MLSTKTFYHNTLQHTQTLQQRAHASISAASCDSRRRLSFAPSRKRRSCSSASQFHGSSSFTRLRSSRASAKLPRPMRALARRRSALMFMLSSSRASVHSFSAAPYSDIAMRTAATFRRQACLLVSISNWSGEESALMKLQMPSALSYSLRASTNLLALYRSFPLRRSCTCSFSALTSWSVESRTVCFVLCFHMSCDGLVGSLSHSRMLFSTSSSVSRPSLSASWACFSIFRTIGFRAHLSKSLYLSFVNVCTMRRRTRFSKNGAMFFCAS